MAALMWKTFQKSWMKWKKGRYHQKDYQVV